MSGYYNAAGNSNILNYDRFQKNSAKVTNYCKTHKYTIAADCNQEPRLVAVRDGLHPRPSNRKRSLLWHKGHRSCCGTGVRLCAIYHSPPGGKMLGFSDCKGATLTGAHEAAAARPKAHRVNVGMVRPCRLASPKN